MSISSAAYHDATGYQRNMMSGHYLDWKNQPDVYKKYPGIEPVSLPRALKLPEIRLSSILKPERTIDHVPVSMDLDNLSRIFLMTYSLTAKARHGGGEFHYRSAPSAGALYPAEIYMAAAGINGLYDGIYHFSIARHGLSLLREGDLSAYIRKAIKPRETGVSALTFFLSAIFFRGAWKYRDRAYRYHLLDTGHLLENLDLALGSFSFSFTHFFDFDDDRINLLLGLDDTKEVSLSLTQVWVPGSGAGKEVHEVKGLPHEIRNASRVSEREIDYPDILETHRSGMEVIPSSVSGHGGMVHELGLNPDTWTNTRGPAVWPETMNFAESVINRRSRRNYVRGAISFDRMTALLECLCVKDSGRSCGSRDVHNSTGIGFLTSNHVEGFPPGLYLLDTLKEKAGMVASGLFMERMARICLDQVWLGNAAVHFLFMTNLEILDLQWGSRGYRYAMLTAGRMGERIYMASTAMGLGCCGIGAFYDGEAGELIGLNKGSRLIYLVAAGPVKGKQYPDKQIG